MYKIHNNLVPLYLQNIAPNIRSTISGYATRNSMNYSLPKCRLEIFNKSFIPDTVRNWNNLSSHTREATSIKSFKKCLQSTVENPPRYFSFGKRFFNIIHTRLRHNCILNSDLFRCNLVDNPNCSCGLTEDAYHLFFVCKKYNTARHCLMNKLLSFNDIFIIDVHLLLWGNESLSDVQNIQLFKVIHSFLDECGRFSKNK